MSFVRVFRSLRRLATRDNQQPRTSKPEFRRTAVQLLHLVSHDYTRKVYGPQDIPGLRVPSPVLPVKKDSLAD